MPLDMTLINSTPGMDKGNTIIREVGKEGYIKYKRSLFKTYCTMENEEILMVIKQEKKYRMMDKQK
eukprot:14269359-Ditylum_brightwellii.AAC.1